MSWFPDTQSRDSEVADAVTRMWENQRLLLEDELGGLVLWKLNFQDSELEIILHESKDLEESVNESLSSIGQTMINSMLQSFFYAVNRSECFQC